MSGLRTLERSAMVCSVLLALLGACTNQREPAEHMMQDIETALGGASEDAAKYVPGELTGVQMKLDDLKTAYDAQDYQAVLARGPAILADAKALAADAAAKKSEIAKNQSDQWTALSAAVPALFTAVQARLDVLSQKKNRKMAAGIDLDAAKSALSDATSAWSKAQGAFGNGNMNEAVSTAQDVETKLQALAGALKAELPVTAALVPQPAR
jgi:hypothetical protein